MPPPKLRVGVVGGTDRQDSIQDSSTGGKQSRNLFEGYKPGDSINYDQLWQLYEWYPTGTIIELFSDACWHAGLKNAKGEDANLSNAMMYEFQQWSLYKDVFGWAGLTKHAAGGKTWVQAWPPKVNNIGIEVPTVGADAKGFFDERGLPKQIKLWNGGVNSTSIQKPNFFLQRTKRGLPGWMGSSMLLPLVALTLSQNKILEDYAFYTALMGRARDVVRDAKAQTKAELNDTRDSFMKYQQDPGYNCIVVGPEINPNTDISHYSGMEGSYDPVPILTFIDKMFCRTLKMSMPILTGEPEGHISSSIMALTAFYARIKEYQDWTMLQVKDALIACGAPEDVRFSDPTELPIEQQATLIKDFIAALTQAEVKKEQIIDWINNLMDTDFERDETEYQKPNTLNTGGTMTGKNTGGKTPSVDSPPRVKETPKDQQGE